MIGRLVTKSREEVRGWTSLRRGTKISVKIFVSHVMPKGNPLWRR